MRSLGRYQVASVLAGTFALDGGAMFGVVPRVLWEPRARPDARHRIPLASRPLVAIDRDARRVVLVDAGLGDKWDATLRDRYAIAGTTGALEAGLAALGIAPGDVTDLILTHLHFDHAGGVTRRRPDGELELCFPRAVHHLQRRQWQWAHAPAERDRASYREEDFELLAHAAELHLVDGEAELLPDLELIVSDGHTVGQQLPRLRGDGTHLTFCGDLIPTHVHLRPSWGLGYDHRPLTTLEEKKVLLAEALEDDGILFLEHDPAMAACRLREVDGRPAFLEAVPL